MSYFKQQIDVNGPSSDEDVAILRTKFNDCLDMLLSLQTQSDWLDRHPEILEQTEVDLQNTAREIYIALTGRSVRH